MPTRKGYWLADGDNGKLETFVKWTEAMKWLNSRLRHGVTRVSLEWIEEEW